MLIYVQPPSYMDEIDFKKNMQSASLATRILSKTSCALEFCEPNSILESLGETVFTRSRGKETQLEGKLHPDVECKVSMWCCMSF